MQPPIRSQFVRGSGDAESAFVQLAVTAGDTLTTLLEVQEVRGRMLD